MPLLKQRQTTPNLIPDREQFIDTLLRSIGRGCKLGQFRFQVCKLIIESFKLSLNLLSFSIKLLNCRAQIGALLFNDQDYAIIATR